MPDHPHPEHHFSHADAARKQAEVFAHLDALQKLESPGGAHIAAVGAEKGPRATYETSTSGPSFGHIFHENGMPTSRHMSMQHPDIPIPLFNIPFGGAVGVHVPRPLIFGPGPLGVGSPMGTAFPGTSPFGPPPESPRGAQRSAYVETVDDVSPALLPLPTSNSHNRRKNLPFPVPSRDLAQSHPPL